MSLSLRNGAQWLGLPHLPPAQCKFGAGQGRSQALAVCGASVTRTSVSLTERPDRPQPPRYKTPQPSLLPKHRLNAVSKQDTLGPAVKLGLAGAVQPDQYVDEIGRASCRERV